MLMAAPWLKGAKNVFLLFYEVSSLSKCDTKPAPKNFDNQNLLCTLQQPNVVSSVNDHIAVTQVSCKRFANFDKISCHTNSLLWCLL